MTKGSSSTTTSSAGTLVLVVVAIVASLGSQRKAIRWIEPCSSSVDIWRKVPLSAIEKENGRWTYEFCCFRNNIIKISWRILSFLWLFGHLHKVAIQSRKEGKLPEKKGNRLIGLCPNCSPWIRSKDRSILQCRLCRSRGRAQSFLIGLCHVKQNRRALRTETTELLFYPNWAVLCFRFVYKYQTRVASTQWNTSFWLFFNIFDLIKYWTSTSSLLFFSVFQIWKMQIEEGGKYLISIPKWINHVQQPFLHNVI